MGILYEDTIELNLGIDNGVNKAQMAGDVLPALKYLYFKCLQVIKQKQQTAISRS